MLQLDDLVWCACCECHSLRNLVQQMDERVVHAANVKGVVDFGVHAQIVPCNSR
jgi:hypothetical protein